MAGLYLYGLFAFTTALAALYEIIYPIIVEQHTLEGHVNDKILIYIVSFCIFVLIAPLLFFACIIPTLGNSYRTAVRKGLFP